MLIVVNNPLFFLSHRLQLALDAKQAGYDVHIATMDGPAVADVISHGLVHHVIPMSRSGKNPLEEARTLYALWRLFRRVRPDVVHAVTIKPVLYGGIAARLAGVKAYVAAISGLGFVFTRQKQGFDFLRVAAIGLYRLALGHPNSRVIFQNTNDRDVLQRARVVRAGQAVMIRGSGVSLDAFPVLPEPEGPVVAIMVARLLRDKGVMEFVEAARIAALRSDGSATNGRGLRWVLVGAPDLGNPASVTVREVEQWRNEGVVECLGERSDIASLYAQAHIAVLPSYREGLPKSLVEAAACGRAVVTTDVPGCRDAIEPGASGLLVPVRDGRRLADAVLRLANDDALRHQMGAEGRHLAEREFDIRKIISAHLAIYDALTNRSA
ncbi:glycosyltransferase family 4 protein [Allopusillimonas ginsengisoli]|uniref:glycosyltransferase family 4 protein n=1 Tax=Allopusillimonas ginsengisoli TaxID=453575 RepID=UPI00289C77C6